MFKNSIILFFPINKENQRDLSEIPEECLQNVNRIVKINEILAINQEKISKCQSLGNLSKMHYGESFCNRAKRDFEIAQKMEYDLLRGLPKNCSKKNIIDNDNE